MLVVRGGEGGRGGGVLVVWVGGRGGGGVEGGGSRPATTALPVLLLSSLPTLTDAGRGDDDDGGRGTKVPTTSTTSTTAFAAAEFVAVAKEANVIVESVFGLWFPNQLSRARSCWGFDILRNAAGRTSGGRNEMRSWRWRLSTSHIEIMVSHSSTDSIGVKSSGFVSFFSQGAVLVFLK